MFNLQYASGEGASYITRRQALRKLQLSLNDFRRLCIIKGIYPREPKNRRRAQRGATDIRILYHTKDIKFLLHEPIVWTLRDYKVCIYFTIKINSVYICADSKLCPNLICHRFSIERQIAIVPSKISRH